MYCRIITVTTVQVVFTISYCYLDYIDCFPFRAPIVLGMDLFQAWFDLAYSRNFSDKRKNLPIFMFKTMNSTEVTPPILVLILIWSNYLFIVTSLASASWLKSSFWIMVSIFAQFLSTYPDQFFSWSKLYLLPFQWVHFWNSYLLFIFIQLWFPGNLLEYWMRLSNLSVWVDASFL